MNLHGSSFVVNSMAARMKKKLNQDDLRKLMRERRENFKNSERKINSPYAKYNSIGQLHCSICNLHIKNENLWPSHILSKVHKQNTEIAKEEEKERSSYKPEPVHCNNGKRKTDPLSPKAKQICIRGKDTIVEDQDSNTRVTPGNSSVASRLSVLDGYSSSSEDESEGDQAIVPHPASTSAQSEASAGNLPPDFFDTPPSETSVPTTSSQRHVFTEPLLSNRAKEKEKLGSENNVDSLPEGFFDDPVLDAKARHVEYKDPMEDEWEKFQKSMAEESHVSEAIMEEDVEESLVERDLDQIDQQIYNWSIVKKLQSQVEEARLATKDKESSKSSESEADEEEYEDLLNNWRAKASWKH